MGLQVLVVDDSGVMRSMVTKAVKMCGLDIAKIHKANDGVEALELMRREAIDLLLIDINMPLMNGEEVVKEMRTIVELADTTVVVISSEGSATRIRRLQDLDASFIKKPFSPSQLRDVLDSLIDDRDKVETVHDTADSDLSF